MSHRAHHYGVHPGHTPCTPHTHPPTKAGMTHSKPLRGVRSSGPGATGRWSTAAFPHSARCAPVVPHRGPLKWSRMIDAPPGPSFRAPSSMSSVFWGASQSNGHPPTIPRACARPLRRTARATPPTKWEGLRSGGSRGRDTARTADKGLLKRTAEESGGGAPWGGGVHPTDREAPAASRPHPAGLPPPSTSAVTNVGGPGGGGGGHLLRSGAGNRSGPIPVHEGRVAHTRGQAPPRRTVHFGTARAPSCTPPIAAAGASPRRPQPSLCPKNIPTPQHRPQPHSQPPVTPPQTAFTSPVTALQPLGNGPRTPHPLLTQGGRAAYLRRGVRRIGPRRPGHVFGGGIGAWGMAADVTGAVLWHWAMRGPWGVGHGNPRRPPSGRSEEAGVPRGQPSGAGPWGSLRRRARTPPPPGGGAARRRGGTAPLAT